MVKVVESIRLDLKDAYDFIDCIAIQFDAMPRETIDRLVKEWRELEDSGAEIADVDFANGVVTAKISNDLEQHLLRFGVLI